MHRGRIIKLITDRGYGFIRTEQGEELLFPYEEIEGVDYNSLREGQQVEYAVEEGRNGRPVAVGVKLAQPKT